jgi:hypothetical protein
MARRPEPRLTRCARAALDWEADRRRWAKMPPRLDLSVWEVLYALRGDVELPVSTSTVEGAHVAQLPTRRAVRAGLVEARRDGDVLVAHLTEAGRDRVARPVLPARLRPVPA